jgi:hypothetical protein
MPTAHEVQFIDLASYMVDGYRPGDPNTPIIPSLVFQREQNADIWSVAGTPLTEANVRWFESHEGAITVPVFSYLTDPQPDLVFGFGLQLAANACLDLELPVRRILLVLARPAQEVRLEDGTCKFRLHAGLAVLLESR